MCADSRGGKSSVSSLLLFPFHMHPLPIPPNRQIHLLPTPSAGCAPHVPPRRTWPARKAPLFWLPRQILGSPIPSRLDPLSWHPYFVYGYLQIQLHNQMRCPLYLHHSIPPLPEVFRSSNSDLTTISALFPVVVPKFACRCNMCCYRQSASGLPLQTAV